MCFDILLLIALSNSAGLDMYVTFQLVFLLREMSSYIQQKFTILSKTTDILSAQKHKNTALHSAYLNLQKLKI